MKVRLATMEESRERLNNQHRELEISIDPMRRELENCKNHIIQMKEDKINEIAELNKRIQLQRYPLGGTRGNILVSTRNHNFL